MPTESQSRSIKRTICIGLGGTGRDILMQIRRLIVDRHGKLSELPVVSFVHIDTDTGASKISGLRTGSTYRGENIIFADAEKVVATMSSQEVNDLSKGLEKRSPYQREGPYDHIASWFAPAILKDLKAIENGAGAIRPVGRLAFFHNYNKIQKAIETAENKTHGNAQQLLRKGLILEPGLNIFIVGSLCGGTGSGMFLDVAYTLREMYKEIENQIVSYLIFSPELYGNTPTMKANSYAALKELNYYASQGTKFEAIYDPQNLFFVSESRPPFDFVYLVNNQTQAGYKILNQEKLCNVIAHKIFADFAEEMATTIQGHRDNLKDKLTKLDEHPRPNVQRYLTFGLAKIYFPRDLSVEISLNQIKLQLLSFWLQGEGQRSDAQVLLERFLLNWRGEREGKDIFTLKLEGITQENNKTFSLTINSWKEQQIENINDCEKPDDRQRFIEQFKGDVQSQFRKVKLGENQSTRGSWLTNIQQNCQKLIQQFNQDIDNYLKELLNPSNPDFSLESSRIWLNALITELNNYQHNLEDKVHNSSNLITPEKLNETLRNISDNLEDIEKHKSFLGIGDRRKKQFQEEAENSLEEIVKLIKCNVDYTLQEEGLKIVKNLQQKVQKLLNQTSSFHHLLENLQNEYQKLSADFKNLNQEDMIGEAIFDFNENDPSYQVSLPSAEEKNRLIMLSNEINQQIGFTSSLFNFFQGDYLIDESELKEKINSTVEKLFSDRSLDNLEPVVTRFMKKYPFSQAAIRLKQILDEAEPLLVLNINSPYYYHEAGKTFQIIGFKDTEERENQQFKQVLIKDIGVGSSVLKPIQNQGEIVIIKEYGGFPLRIINGLTQLREQYNRQLQYDYFSLHNDYTKTFIDPIPPNANEMEEIQDVFYTCLALELIGENPMTKMYELQSFDPLLNEYSTAEFSSIWSEALEQIANSHDLSESLKKIYDQTIETITQQPILWQDIYLPKLQNFAKKVNQLQQNDPNYLEKNFLLGVKKPKPKDGILTRIANRILTLISKASQGSSPNNNFNNNPKLIEASQPVSSANNSSNKKPVEVEPISDVWNEPIDVEIKDSINNSQLIKDINPSPNPNNYSNQTDTETWGNFWQQGENQVENIDVNFIEKWKDITPLQLFEMHKEGLLTQDEVAKIKKYVLGL